MTNENWERFGELNDLNWDAEMEKWFDSCRTDPKRMIFLLVYKKWKSKVIPNSIKNSAHEITDPFAANKVIIQHSLRLSKENWFMLQKNNLWKSQKEPGYFIVEEMHKYLKKLFERFNQQFRRRRKRKIYN